MYTRNYRNDYVNESINDTQNNDLEQNRNEKIDNINNQDIPMGYSGTTMLKKREENDLETDEFVNDSPDNTQEIKDSSHYIRSENDDTYNKSNQNNYESERVTSEKQNDYDNQYVNKESNFQNKNITKSNNKKINYEDILLFALIILLLNERSDDLTHIALGYLLISDKF